jgi:aminopeptidase N
MASRAWFAVVLGLSCLTLQAQSVQQFDQPEPGALSPRNANYTIDVQLDHVARTLRGSATLRWRNISTNPTSELRFHLYWNAWRNADSTWMRERRLAGTTTPVRADAWGSQDISRLQLKSAGSSYDLLPAARFIAPDDGNAADRTVLAVPLPMSVGPNETVEIEFDWTARIPRPFARTGVIDDHYFIAHWFPKIGVLEDSGWNAHQFHAATEFYSDYGVYDVRLTTPRDFVVGATGCRPPVADQPRQGCPDALAVDNSDGVTRTHRFWAADVHDFAWVASPDFIVQTRTFEHPTLPHVQMRLLVLPEHAHLSDRYFRSVSETLRLFGEWFGPYPYGLLTIVDPAFQGGNGGMEYPMLITGRSNWIAPPGVTVPEATTAHEAGHQWWHTVIGSNEFEHAWMDEGMTTWATGRVLDESFSPNFVERRFFGSFIPWVFRDLPLRRDTDLNRLPGYRDNAEADVPATPSYRYWPSTATFITYNKTSLWLHMLEKRVGWPAMQRIMATYYERWRFRHPQPDDFFLVVSEVAGEDYSWFFDQVYRSSNTFDYGVQEFTSTPSRTTVVVRRYGEATYPVEIVTTFRDGESVTETWDGRDRRVVYLYERPSQALSVQVDPRRRVLLDVNYTNNSRTLEPRATEAGRKWGLKWMVWLQDLMLTYGFFI